MIRAFAKKETVPTLDGTQVQQRQASAAAEEAHLRSSVHQLQENFMTQQC